MKHILLLAFIGVASLAFGQAADGAPDFFIAVADGDWDDPNTWNPDDGVDDVGAGEDGIPDGDDVVIIEGFNITVTADAGFGELEFSNSTTLAKTLTINSGITLTGFDTDEGGTASVNGDGVASADRTRLIINNGTLICTGLTIMTSNTLARATVEVSSTSTLTINGNLTFNSAGLATKAKLDGDLGTGNVVNITGSINGINTSKGVLDLHHLTNNCATINFNGTTAQIIPISGTNGRYRNIQISNAAGVSPEGVLISGVFDGNFTTSVGGVFNDGGFANVFPINLTNAGTYNGSGTIDLAGDFTNSGTFTAGGVSGCDINLEGDWANSGTYTYL